MNSTNIPNKKFLGIDLDGTLLTPRKKIALQSIQAIARFKAAYPETVIAIVTGRAYNSAKRYLDYVNSELKSPVISYLACFNGAAVYRINSNGVSEQIHKNLVPDLIAEKIWYSCLQNKVFFWGYPQEMYKGAPCLVGRHPVGKMLQMLRWKEMHYLQHYVHSNYFKINVMMFYPKRIETFLKNFASIHTDQIEVARASPKLVEITVKGTNKGTAVEKICELENIPYDHRFAIGDSGNDIAMFLQVKYKAAIYDAPKELIKLATYVGTNHKKGRFSCVFDNYFLKLKGI
ncbi:HAD-IIB family hydrolase [[Mycoplasma] testudinis]|uniref:HAD-IIB family hydrolase n=1 Tax=[Mycoplasma] testudinis TaxID=33924 RepID=UPI000486DE80|nr:HAD family hydrolase [[Mycoplasma] testudinis]